MWILSSQRLDCLNNFGGWEYFHPCHLFLVLENQISFGEWHFSLCVALMDPYIKVPYFPLVKVQASGNTLDPLCEQQEKKRLSFHSASNESLEVHVSLTPGFSAFLVLQSPFTFYSPSGTPLDPFNIFFFPLSWPELNFFFFFAPK